ncbi:MAG: DUF2087 domain-containing protein [Chloroflexi bacterium]|nr:DUF2087 domain-containing protein [Chloroflexota bacterium]
MSHITAAQFADRFVALILAGRELPKKHLDRHIVLISSILKIEPGRRYSEKEINEQLQIWIIHFGRSFDLDHVTLRRYLVDEKYLSRDPTGGTYELAAKGWPYTFDESIRELDLVTQVAEAKQARELKKQQYLKQSSK